MKTAEITFIELDRGYQVLADGESVGLIHYHNNHWIGTIGGQFNFGHSSMAGLIVDMRAFWEEWKATAEKLRAI